jgi:demethylmenaquinone methyltransferase/2-methoxy-6-polyprenyl-1,4-benzoquinol methylase
MQLPEERTIRDYFDARVGLFEDFPSDQAAKVEQCLREWDIDQGDRVLEPGCGSGRLTARLAGLVGSTGLVHAFDVSHAMIRRAFARGLPSQARFLRASANAIPLPGATFDLVICFCVFPHFLSPARTLAEFRRVLRPGGRLIVQHIENREGMNAFHREHAPDAPSLPLPSDPEMNRLFRHAGFLNVDIREHPPGYRATGLRP